MGEFDKFEAAMHELEKSTGKPFQLQCPHKPRVHSSNYIGEQKSNYYVSKLCGWPMIRHLKKLVQSRILNKKGVWLTEADLEGLLYRAIVMGDTVAAREQSIAHKKRAWYTWMGKTVRETFDGNSIS